MSSQRINPSPYLMAAIFWRCLKNMVTKPESMFQKPRNSYEWLETGYRKLRTKPIPPISHIQLFNPTCPTQPSPLFSESLLSLSRFRPGRKWHCLCGQNGSSFTLSHLLYSYGALPELFRIDLVLCHRINCASADSFVRHSAASSANCRLSRKLRRDSAVDWVLGVC